MVSLLSTFSHGRPSVHGSSATFSHWRPSVCPLCDLLTLYGVPRSGLSSLASATLAPQRPSPSPATILARSASLALLRRPSLLATLTLLTAHALLATLALSGSILAPAAAFALDSSCADLLHRRLGPARRLADSDPTAATNCSGPSSLLFDTKIRGLKDERLYKY